MPRPPLTRPPAAESGVALVLVLIFTVLLYVLIAELVTTAQMARMSGENESLIVRMRDQMHYTMVQVEEGLQDDAEASESGEGGDGGMPGLGGEGGGGGGGGEGESASDSSQDPWFQPTGYADTDLTTYVWVEDENRKFNLLSMISKDEEFARESRERFVRLIDALREDSDTDLSSSDGEELANAILDWLHGRGRNDALPRPPLKSDDTKRADITLPLHLDELLLLRGVTEDLFFDKIERGRIVLGLESVLTIYTSLKSDPGDPTKAGKPVQQQTNMPNSTPQPQTPAAGGNAAEDTPLGQGIKININTASRPVLRSLFPASDIPDAVIDAIIRYRNEEAPAEEEGEEGGEGAAAGAPGGDPNSALSYAEDLDTGEEPKKKIFPTVQDLEQVPEFQNMSNAGIKQKLYELTTTQSDVFSIHMAGLYKRDEEKRVYVMQRARAIVVRMKSGEDTVLHPLVPLESRHGLRLMPVDLQDEMLRERERQLDDMDHFTREERKWNPFHLEFYLEDPNAPTER